ncbi:MAG: hypothetical protein DMF60_15865 [Acidobacteria bacterium]|nr:MAG: hypothetical protein DMF60_15865 [Acidobacteriota bacterium]
MTVLVTGGTGFVGSHLVRALLERGEQVQCLVRSTSRRDNLEDLPVELVTGDLRHLDSLRRAAKGCRVVYHCAADYRLWCKTRPRCIRATSKARTTSCRPPSMKALTELSTQARSGVSA